MVALRMRAGIASRRYAGWLPSVANRPTLLCEIFFRPHKKNPGHRAMTGVWDVPGGDQPCVWLDTQINHAKHSEHLLVHRATRCTEPAWRTQIDVHCQAAIEGMRKKEPQPPERRLGFGVIAWQ